jgi:hypothetical protein
VRSTAVERLKGSRDLDMAYRAAGWRDLDKNCEGPQRPAR